MATSAPKIKLGVSSAKYKTGLSAPKADVIKTESKEESSTEASGAEATKTTKSWKRSTITTSKVSKSTPSINIGPSIVKTQTIFTPPKASASSIKSARKSDKDIKTEETTLAKVGIHDSPDGKSKTVTTDENEAQTSAKSLSTSKPASKKTTQSNTKVKVVKSAPEINIGPAISNTSTSRVATGKTRSSTAKSSSRIDFVRQNIEEAEQQQVSLKSVQRQSRSLNLTKENAAGKSMSETSSDSQPMKDQVKESTSMSQKKSVSFEDKNISANTADKSTDGTDSEAIPVPKEKSAVDTSSPSINIGQGGAKVTAGKKASQPEIGIQPKTTPSKTITDGSPTRPTRSSDENPKQSTTAVPTGQKSYQPQIGIQPEATATTKQQARSYDASPKRASASLSISTTSYQPQIAIQPEASSTRQSKPSDGNIRKAPSAEKANVPAVETSQNSPSKGHKTFSETSLSMKDSAKSAPNDIGVVTIKQHDSPQVDETDSPQISQTTIQLRSQPGKVADDDLSKRHSWGGTVKLQTGISIPTLQREESARFSTEVFAAKSLTDVNEMKASRQKEDEQYFRGIGSLKQLWGGQGTFANYLPDSDEESRKANEKNETMNIPDNQNVALQEEKKKTETDSHNYVEPSPPWLKSSYTSTSHTAVASSSEVDKPAADDDAMDSSPVSSLQYQATPWQHDIDTPSQSFTSSPVASFGDFGTGQAKPTDQAVKGSPEGLSKSSGPKPYAAVKPQNHTENVQPKIRSGFDCSENEIESRKAMPFVESDVPKAYSRVQAPGTSPVRKSFVVEINRVDNTNAPETSIETYHIDNSYTTNLPSGYRSVKAPQTYSGVSGHQKVFSSVAVEREGTPVNEGAEFSHYSAPRVNIGHQAYTSQIGHFATDVPQVSSDVQGSGFLEDPDIAYDTPTASLRYVSGISQPAPTFISRGDDVQNNGKGYSAVQVESAQPGYESSYGKTVDKEDMSTVKSTSFMKSSPVGWKSSEPYERREEPAVSSISNMKSVPKGWTGNAVDEKPSQPDTEKSGSASKLYRPVPPPKPYTGKPGLGVDDDFIGRSASGYVYSGVTANLAAQGDGFQVHSQDQSDGAPTSCSNVQSSQKVAKWSPGQTSQSSGYSQVYGGQGQGNVIAQQSYSGQQPSPGTVTSATQQSATKNAITRPYSASGAPKPYSAVSTSAASTNMPKKTTGFITNSTTRPHVHMGISPSNNYAEKGLSHKVTQDSDSSDENDESSDEDYKTVKPSDIKSTGNLFGHKTRDSSQKTKISNVKQKNKEEGKKDGFSSKPAIVTDYGQPVSVEDSSKGSSYASNTFSNVSDLKYVEPSNVSSTSQYSYVEPQMYGESGEHQSYRDGDQSAGYNSAAHGPALRGSNDYYQGTAVGAEGQYIDSQNPLTYSSQAQQRFSTNDNQSSVYQGVGGQVHGYNYPGAGGDPGYAGVCTPKHHTVAVAERGFILDRDSVSGASSPFVVAYDELLKGEFARYLDLSGKIGGDVFTQASQVEAAFKGVRDFLVLAATSKKPAQNVLADLLKPLSEFISQIQEFREKNRTSTFFNHLSGVSEAINAIGWVSVEPTPGPFVKDMQDAGMFYTNRVIKDFKEKDQIHVDWTKAWMGSLRELMAYIKQYHTTGVSWNPQGGEAKAAAPKAPAAPAAGGAPPPPPGPPPPPPPAVEDSGSGEADSKAALFAEINRGTAISSGLRKVTDDMKTHKNPALRAGSTVSGSSSTTSVRSGPKPFKATAPPTAPKPGATKQAAAVKPPVLELQDKKWIVEYQSGNKNMVIENTNLKQTVYMYKCDNSTLVVKGKINSITVDSCKKVAVAFDAVVSSIEFVNSQSVQAQTMGQCPTVSIDKTDGCQMYLSKESLNAEIVTAKSSEMNILVPKDDGDFAEFALPEQFKSTWNGKKFRTDCTESV